MSITANLKKTYYYCKKNGIVDTYYALRERLYARTSPLYLAGYDYVPVPEEELQKQRETVFDKEMKFSILVPMYETNPQFACAMIDSVLAQTYTNWELILADASKTDVVKSVVCGKTIGMVNDDDCSGSDAYASDPRIRYVQITENKGISENTNDALKYATGDYVALLDHDDLLTPDALYEMALAIQAAEKNGKTVAFVYSDEDKCDTEAKKYYEPNVKTGFNVDLLFSNNYICHFLVMKSELMKKVGFRKEYDGAQDFDLVLRAFMQKGPSDLILHVNKVLYHWRCHESSTAANPQSKLYAYEAGKRAVESALEEYLMAMHGRDSIRKITKSINDGNIKACNNIIYVNDIPVRVVHTKHNGFYRIKYGTGTTRDIFNVRKDIGIVAGPVIRNNKITGGIIGKNGKPLYFGVPAKYSGYMHRMVLQQNCECVDATNAVVRPGLNAEFEKKIDRREKINLDLIQEKGDYLILYDPEFRKE